MLRFGGNRILLRGAVASILMHLSFVRLLPGQSICGQCRGSHCISGYCPEEHRLHSAKGSSLICLLLGYLPRNQAAMRLLQGFDCSVLHNEAVSNSHSSLRVNLLRSEAVVRRFQGLGYLSPHNVEELILLPPPLSISICLWLEYLPRLQPIVRRPQGSGCKLPRDAVASTLIHQSHRYAPLGLIGMQ